MYKEILIGKKTPRKLALLANGATPLFYKQVFKKDLLRALSNGGEMEIAGDNIPELAFIMAKQAEKADMTKLNFESYIEWLSQFEALDMALSGAKIADVYIADSMTGVEPKKNGKGKAKE